MFVNNIRGMNISVFVLYSVAEMWKQQFSLSVEEATQTGQSGFVDNTKDTYITISFTRITYYCQLVYYSSREHDNIM